MANRTINRTVKSLIRRLASYQAIDLMPLAYRQRGILKGPSIEVSGEKYLIEQILPQLLPSPNPVLFDVGANKGTYALALHRQFPNATIHAFEPNPHAFNCLQRASASAEAMIHNVGLSDRNTTAILHTYERDLASGHATLHRNVMTDLHRATHIAERTVGLRTLTDFCAANQIDRIDFMKIDTEGHELAVLKGGAALIREERIGIVQFEFNEMNIVSRTWLKDFYDLLPGYAFFRLDSRRLIELGAYSPHNEIFAFQNILAIPAKCRSWHRSCFPS